MQSSSARNQSFVVVVQRTENTRDVYGPYRSFKAAEGDARAWGGTVEPIQKIAQGVNTA
jgi:hypothetical protein